MILKVLIALILILCFDLQLYIMYDFGYKQGIKAAVHQFNTGKQVKFAEKVHGEWVTKEISFEEAMSRITELHGTKSDWQMMVLDGEFAL